MQQLNLITSSNKTIMYDQYCKMLIGHPFMLSRIISCFVEEAKYLSLDEIKKLIIFKWNRVYPADQYLDIDPEKMTKVQEEEFVGFSHEKITMEVYEK